MNNRTIIQDASGINTFIKIYSLLESDLEFQRQCRQLMLSMFHQLLFLY